MIKSWKKISEKRLYDGYRKLLQKRFIMPDGEEEDYDIIEDGDTVGIFAITEKNEVLVCQQFLPGIEQIRYTLPGGYVNKEEPVESAAARELLEETGYAGDMKFIAEFPEATYSTIMRHCFVATNCKKVHVQHLDDTEFIQLVVMPLEAFKHLLRNGEIL